jgi:Rad3-related DNA helicase
VSWALTVPIALKRSYQQTMLKYKLTKNPSLLHRLYAMEELSSAVEEIGRMPLDSWVCEMRQGTKYGQVWDFDPVWPGMYAESRLFCGVKKVVLMSATLRPASMAMLGINMREAEFREWPRVFPANRTPVYAIPTIRMNHRNTEEDLSKWVARIDEIISTRTERKGLIHTVSYSRQKYILEHSKYAAYMLANTGAPDSDSAMEIMSKFKASSAPSILVSPSFSTGVDFPMRQCEWQIICKVPFADLRSKVMAARNERNKTYVNYLAMQEIVQASGRGSRSKLDRCEVFIVDSNVLWFMQQNKGLAPRWFELIRTATVPAPGLRVPEFKLVEIKPV